LFAASHSLSQDSYTHRPNDNHHLESTEHVYAFKRHLIPCTKRINERVNNCSFSKNNYFVPKHFHHCP